MRLVVQRVNSASVTVGGEKVPTGRIGKGLFVLLGVSEADNEDIVDKLAEKLSKLRIMADEKGKMNLSVKDVKAPILVVSQFTLYADTSGGNRPSFIKAGLPERANELYEYFVEKLDQLGVETQAGSFGDYMLIDAQMDGPVTIILDEE